MRAELLQTTERLIDEISADPVNWRAQEHRLRQVIAAHEKAGMKLPSHLRVYESWLSEDDAEDAFENLPV
ncbi:hypothetical protein [Maritimibacter sp. DP1N21-5]|uniref:hypothetical protein n=1 Tax=Maritimibacter sp. DP1N21-5 TaxID=2836867 RepID=UPI001C479551|nr:hypothetical protein [Maritimibacter sp. DP1N21-5]MBV7410339.1 hypothetical protein [Maritimibacter sp. DP1N21-5]